MPGTIHDAYREAVAKYGHRRQVTGIDIGPKYKNKNKTETQSIRIHVVAKRDGASIIDSEKFDKEIRGFPVDVLQRNYVPAIEGLRGTGGSTASHRSRELMPGISVSQPLCPTGTLGLIVRDTTDESNAILTNWHILADSSFARPGDVVMQPGVADGGRRADAVATFKRGILEAAGDAAIATLDRNQEFTNVISEIGKAPSGFRDPRPGEIVVKIGRTTGFTKGRVEGIDGTYYPIYRTKDRIGISGFEIVPLEGHKGEISSNGDSGAAWLAEDTLELVGIHFAGERNPREQEVAIACYATKVFKELKISLPC